MNDSLNREHWNVLNKNYSNVWVKPAKRFLSQKELSFICSYIKSYSPKNILDIGVGNGRILENHLEQSKANEIYGVDIAEEMVEVCRTKFKKESRIKGIEVCNIAREKIPFDKKFDLISSIRVLKYNQNWPQILEKIYNQLQKGGVCIFTMPNNHSVSALYKDKFSAHNLPIYYTNPSKLEHILKKLGFKVLEIRGLSKLPNFLYDLNSASLYVKTLMLSERALEVLFGRRLLGRELFIACEKI
jgi:ubiquinone/menaquinone biosynthesis C-methylase UbiE